MDLVDQASNHNMNKSLLDSEITKLVNYCIGSNIKCSNEEKKILEKFFELNGEIIDINTPPLHRGEYLYRTIKKYGFKNKFYKNFKDNFYIDISKLTKNIPIIGFNRSIRNINNSNIVLFPLEKYQEPDLIKKNYYNVRNFKEKKSKLIWRGSMTGALNSVYGGGYFFHGIKKYKPKDNSFFYFMCYSRFVFCYYNKFNNYVDAGFTNNHELISEYPSLCKERVSIKEQCNYKYHIALNGNDWATSLPWQLLNHNVVFIPYPFEYESIYTYDLKPWVHFVPVSTNFCDFERNFNKINSNINLGETIAKNAHEYMLKFIDNDFFDKFTKQILDKYVTLL
jgi:hypothetical protein